MYLFYKVLLYIHIVSAVLSVGPFFVLIPMIRKLKGADVGVEQVYLEVCTYTIRLAKHAGHVLVITGALLVMIGSWSWLTSWIVMTILIMVCSGFFLVRAFSPTIKKFNNPSENKDASILRLTRSIWTYISLLMLMLWFMVAKPMFW